jgi:hypothetical protein
MKGKEKETFMYKIMSGLIAIVFAYYIIKDVICKDNWLCILTTGGTIFAIVILAVKKYWGVLK